jgi:peptide/nickel transport system substrate-binding protein
VDLRVAPVYRQRPEGQSGYALERLSFQIYESFDVGFQALQSGDVDAYAAQSKAERTSLASTPFNIYTSLEPALGAVIFNWAKEGTNFFREQRVRLGLATGLERNGIVERHLPNLAARADSPLIPGSWAYTSVFWPAHDAAIALSLLESAQISTSSGEDSETLVPTEPSELFYSFNILVPDDPALIGMAQEIAAQWSQLKLQVSVESVDMATYRQRLEAHDFDSALVELWLGADPDVYDFWDQGQYPDGKNYGGVDDRRISEVLERGRQDVNGLNRKVFYTEFQREFAERAIAVPLYYPLFTYVTAPNVNGVQLGFIGAPPDRFRTIQNWTVSTP